MYAILNEGRVFEADLWGNFSSRALCGNYPDSFNRENPSHGKVSLSACGVRTYRHLNCFTVRLRATKNEIFFFPSRNKKEIF